MSKLKQVQIQSQVSSEEFWRNKLEELGKRFDEIVAEVLKADFERRSNPYEPVVNSISLYISDLVSKLHSIVDVINSDMCEKGVLYALAKLEDIADDIAAFAKSIRKTLPK
jgi:Txe/YoeB family toxin of Txe-Axe toxin-antitoxin module